MFDFLPRLSPGEGAPLYAQLVAELRGAILAGRLQPGEKLPSTRGLSERLGVSRTTVTEAYDQLVADGYLTARGGSGTYVTADLPAAHAAPTCRPAKASAGPDVLSGWARRLGAAPLEAAPAAVPSEVNARRPAAACRGTELEIDFRPSAAAWEAFPHETWRRLAARSWRRAPTQGLGYGGPAGWPPLREAIAAYLGRLRGVRCTADDIVIVNGSQQALDILARLCLDVGDAVVVEDPGYPSARRTFAAYGATLLPVPVDTAGLDAARLPAPPLPDRPGAGEARIKLVYVTPSHQYPTGATLSPARRLALLRWAAEADAVVLEDDYDSEFRYEGRPVESLQGLDGGGRVVYLGTFSKVLAPSFRLGYVVLPPALRGPFVAAKDLADRETAAPEQRVLAEFIADGHFERHVRRMRRLYARRRAALLEALTTHARDLIVPAPAQTGMHTLVRIELGDVIRGAGAPPAAGARPGSAAARVVPLERIIAEQAARAGVGIYPAGGCWGTPPQAPMFLLGFAGLDEARIEAGVRRLARVIQRLGRSTHRLN